MSASGTETRAGSPTPKGGEGVRYPLPEVPNGWWHVGHSADLAPGDVKPVRYFGRELVLFRTEGGVARAMDAHCPHLGAHLGHGGTVVGERLRCPFHGWEYDERGRCVHIPYSSVPPLPLRTKRWPLLERNQMLYLYFDAEGREPDWEFPLIPEFYSEGYLPLVVERFSSIATHPQEIGENVVDTAHFHNVHAMEHPPDRSLKVRPGEHDFVVEQFLRMEMKTSPGKVRTVEVPTHTTNIGPGFGLVRVVVGDLAKTTTSYSYTPIGDGKVCAWVSVAVKDTGSDKLNRIVSEMTLESSAGQFAQDIPIWENKAFYEKPRLCDADANIGVWRRWYQRFYSTTHASGSHLVTRPQDALPKAIGAH